MVSEWMENGNIMEFTRKNPSVARPKLVRFSLEALALPIADNYTMGVAGGCCPGVDLPARLWNHPRGC